ncbi:hypothetical protein HJD18_04165 [Thermoleophilia bacterium SCSIO 60948]|nr:hypothetical protein HJD18_04165 [Thermoleophilia bacterium SCSIO 60948]
MAGEDRERSDFSVALVTAIALGVAALGIVAAILTLLADDEMAPAQSTDIGRVTESRFEVESAAVGETLPVEVVEPPGGSEGRPLVVFLHGRGQDERSQLDEQGLFDGIAAAGSRAPVFAFPYGGESSYWHDRADGDWGSYVTEELIPELERRLGTDPGRVAIGGISMGGFGALDLARLDPDGFCAAAGHSPALWRSFEETPEGAFDDADDFAGHDVLGAAESDPEGFAGDTELWVDIGESDPLEPGVDTLEAELAPTGRLESKRGPGGHESEYWSAEWASYVGFYADALSRCSTEQPPPGR